METVSLKAELRKMNGHKVSALRAAGKVPCVTYGHNIKSENVEVLSGELEKAFAAAGASTIVELELGSEKKNVVIHDVQEDPVTGKIIHCDFYQVNMNEKITTDVNLNYTGVSAAVKDFAGILIKAVDKLEIEALPKDLPHEIKVDLALLAKIDDSITLDQLDIPEGVEVMGMDKNQVIASVTPPRSEEELSALDEEVTEDVEGVEGVKKEDEGEEEETEGKEAKKAEKAEKEEGESEEKEAEGSAEETKAAEKKSE